MVEQGHLLEALGAIEQGLTERLPFGDSEYILNQLQICLKSRLDKVASDLPVAGQILEVLEQSNSAGLHRVIGDTVVRCAIIHAHIQVETGKQYGLPLKDCEEIFTATIHHLQDNKFDTPLDQSSLHRLGPKPHHGWIWSEEHPNDIFGRSFRYLLKERYHAVPRTPSNEEIAVLVQGAQLLQDLLPTLTPSALIHAHVIACVPNAGQWKGVASSSQFYLGGTIFLGSPLSNPWWVAEHLLHESLHQKLYDFRHSHSLLEELRYAREDAPRVHSPWNSPQLNKSNLWDVHRVFAAFHVYVHLALLAIVAEQRAAELEKAYGPFAGMLASRKALERAHYLGEKLKEKCWDELGLAGKRLTDWLSTVLEFLDPSPPPKGSFVHLSLDLYEREAKRVAGVLKEIDSVPSLLPQRLVPLAKEEIQAAQRLLSSIDAQQELRQLNDAVAQYADHELGTNFPEVRHAIRSALLDASTDRYRLTESGTQDELLKQMIENASQQLYPAVVGYPTAVADAKRRETDLQFPMSCTDHVGRLLAVLAAAVPSGGRILEIGTGVGVGTAWIIAGLDGRTDVQVVSVEIDQRLSSAAREWPWPVCVQIVTADILVASETLGEFNLVFADASPFKYTNVGFVLATLSPGGILVVDDLGEPNFSERQQADKAALRQLLMHHRELHAVDIEWSTGMILATKKAGNQYGS